MFNGEIQSHLIPTRRTTLRKTVQCMAVLKRQSSCGGWKKTGRFHQFTDVTNKNMRFIHIWLVVYLPLWKMMEFISWDDDIPNWMESHKSHVPNHQPDIYHYLSKLGVKINRTHMGMQSHFMPWKVSISVCVLPFLKPSGLDGAKKSQGTRQNILQDK